MVTPYEEYVEVCEELAELTPGDHEKRSALFNSGAEAVENAVKIARHATGRDGGRRVRPRLPRPHQPDDGADRQEHALQARLRAVRRRDLPRADGLPATAGRAAPSACADEAFDAFVDDRSTPRSARTTSPPSSSSRSRARAASSCRRRASCPASPTGAASTASCSSPTRSRPASAAPATGSPATTRASCPT